MINEYLQKNVKCFVLRKALGVRESKLPERT